ncbi:MAG: DNA repair protein RecO [Kiritimatiellae bacterium]|nr:DNA repair protein RecO [Kiritimatiellia bacterium]
MIIKTQAIALKISPFSETSRVVVWLTAEHGKIATIIKGAQRPRNFFLGQYDLFYTCELLFYLRVFHGLHIVKECCPLKTRAAFRSYWPGTACASYFAGLAARIAPFYAPQPNLYPLLETALDIFMEPPAANMRGGQALAVSLFWFELKLLGAMGFAPRLNACLQCRRILPLAAPGRGNGSIAFSAARGGVFCDQCAGQHKNDSIRIMPDRLALLKFWQSSRNIQAARNAVCTEHQLKDVRVMLGAFLQYHLETENSGRDIALSLLKKRRERDGQAGPGGAGNPLVMKPAD